MRHWRRITISIFNCAEYVEMLGTNVIWMDISTNVVAAAHCFLFVMQQRTAEKIANPPNVKPLSGREETRIETLLKRVSTKMGCTCTMHGSGEKCALFGIFSVARRHDLNVSLISNAVYLTSISGGL